MEPWGCGQYYLNDIVWADFVAGLGGLLVDADKVVLNGQLNLIARSVGQAIHQEFVDPEQRLLGVDSDSVVLKEAMLLVDMGVFSLQDCLNLSPQKSRKLLL